MNSIAQNIKKITICTIIKSVLMFSISMLLSLSIGTQLSSIGIGPILQGGQSNLLFGMIGMNLFAGFAAVSSMIIIVSYIFNPNIGIQG